MKTFIITEELAQSIVNFLITKPFGEVHQLMSDIQQLEQLQEPEADAKALQPKEDKK